MYFRKEGASKPTLHNFGDVNSAQYDSVKFLDLSFVKWMTHGEEIAAETQNRYLSGILPMCPSLRKLSLQGLRLSNQCFTLMISTMKTLTHLNLFSCRGKQKNQQNIPKTHIFNSHSE